MMALGGDTKIWLCSQVTDMRKSYDGLIALVKQVLDENPHSGALFVFINRRRTQMKCLYFESTSLHTNIGFLNNRLCFKC